MSAVLVVTKSKKQIARVAVTGPKFSIGRGNQCDLPVDEELASRKHVEITFENGAYSVQDLGSTNGTTLNGQKLAARSPLKDGDEIGIGSTRLRFLCDVVRGAAGGEDDLTRPAQPGAELPASAPAQPAAEQKPTGPLRVKLRISGGPLDGGVFKNWPSPLTIGRGLENNVVLLDNAVSTTHSRIVTEQEAYFVEDLDSANGTFVNGVKVRRQQLVHGQKIKVGASTLVFELVDVRVQRRNLKMILLGVGSVILLLAAMKLLLPPDRAGLEIERGRQFAIRNELEKSFDAYQAALKIDPNRTEAKEEFAKIKASLDARHMLQSAEKAAEEEKYDQAKELVYRVLGDFPKDQRALELEAVIKSIENSAVAIKARNWSDAVSLLEKAREKYPKSKLISSYLDSAQKELLAERSLVRARDAIKNQQFQVAEGLLAVIPSTSAYYAEARGHLDNIGREKRTAESLQKADAHYRAGEISEALADLDEGLKAVPNQPALIELRDRARKLEAMQTSLAQAQALKQTDELETLLAGRKTCDNVLQLEPDPLNAVRKRAQETRINLDQWLRALSQNYTSQAQALGESAPPKDTFRLYNMALKADPANQTAVKGAAKLRDAIQRECRRLYGEGLRFEELQEKALAQDRFKKVVEIAPPEDDYYKKASLKLK